MRDAVMHPDVLDMLVAEIRRRLGCAPAPTPQASVEELSADLRIATHYGDPVEVIMAALQLFGRGAKVSRMTTVRHESDEYQKLLKELDVGLEKDAEREARKGRDRRDKPRGPDRRRSAGSYNTQAQGADVGASLQRGDTATDQTLSAQSAAVSPD